MRSGNPFGDHGQRAIMLALIFKPVLANENGVGMPAPLSHQCRADFRDERGIEGPAFLRKFSGEGLKAAPQCHLRPASSTLLQLMGEGADQQIATDPCGGPVRCNSRHASRSSCVERLSSSAI